MCANYPSDLTDEQWQLIRPLLPKRKKRGRPPIDRRNIIDAILYVVRTAVSGDSCRSTSLNGARSTRCSGVGARRGYGSRFTIACGDAFVGQRVKRAHPRRRSSTASRCVRPKEVKSVANDAGKKITGRKRHLAVDTLGLVWAVVVHGASWQDQEGAHFVFACLSQQCQRLKITFADSAYARDGLPEWVRTTFGWILQTVLRPLHAKGFVVLPKRWIVERTFSWLVRYRRHARDYERNTETSEAMIYIAMISLMSRRLARKTYI